MEDIGNLSCFAIDDVSTRGDDILSIARDKDPARHIAGLDIRNLLRRHHRVIEDMHIIIRSIREPNLFFVRGKRDAVTWTAVALHRSGLESLDRNLVELLASFDIS